VYIYLLLPNDYFIFIDYAKWKVTKIPWNLPLVISYPVDGLCKIAD